MAGFAAAVLTIEHALLLLPLYFIYEITMVPPKSLVRHLPLPAERSSGWWRGYGARLFQELVRYAPLVLVAVVFLAVKRVQGGLVMSAGEAAAAAAPIPSGLEMGLRLSPDRTWLVILNTPYRAYLDLLMSASYLFFPVAGCYGAEDTWLTRHAGLVFIPWLAIHLAVIWKGRPVARFLLLWLYLYMLPLALASVPQARYYYMATLPAAGLVALALVGLWDGLRRWLPSTLIGAVMAVVLAAVIYGESVFIRARLKEWELGSTMVRRTVSLLQQDLTPGVREVYLLNVPRAVPSPFWHADAFNNAA